MLSEKMISSSVVTANGSIVKQIKQRWPYVPFAGGIYAIIMWQQMVFFQGLVFSFLTVLLIELTILIRRLDWSSKQLSFIETKISMPPLEQMSLMFNPVIHGYSELLNSLHLFQRADFLCIKDRQDEAKTFNNTGISKLVALKTFLSDYTESDNLLSLSKRFAEIELSKRSEMVHQYQQMLHKTFDEWRPSKPDSFAVLDASLDASNSLSTSNTLKETIHAIISDLDEVIAVRNMELPEKKHSLKKTVRLLSKSTFVLHGIAHLVCAQKFNCSFHHFNYYAAWAAHGIIIILEEFINDNKNGSKNTSTEQQ